MSATTCCSDRESDVTGGTFRAHSDQHDPGNGDQHGGLSPAPRFFPMYRVGPTWTRPGDDLIGIVVPPAVLAPQR